MFSGFSRGGEARAPVIRVVVIVVFGIGEPEISKRHGEFLSQTPPHADTYGIGPEGDACGLWKLRRKSETASRAAISPVIGGYGGLLSRHTYVPAAAQSLPPPTCRTLKAAG